MTYIKNGYLIKNQESCRKIAAHFSNQFLMKKITTLVFLLFSVSMIFAQRNTAVIRGNVYDKASGQPIPYANILLRGTQIGTNTDMNGFFTLNNVPAGSYEMFVSFVGYDSTTASVAVKSGEIVYKSFYLNETTTELEGVEISARKENKVTRTQVSAVSISPREIKALPSTGGEPDIAQFLPVLPGIVSTGDQGGQIYIRGGAPVQNRILLDGMTIFNPFHSIGFFSVFETETVRSVDVLTGGFGAEYGGRVSAIVDIKTREGNKKRWGGLVSGSPFQAKFMVEGPLIKLKDEKGTSLSVMFTGKQSLLDKTSKSLYQYATPNDSTGLPFQYKDYFGKISLVTEGGSRINAFGFNFSDGVNYSDVANYNWTNTGFGTNFQLVPNNFRMVIGGGLSYSNYNIGLKELNNSERSSGVKSFGVNLDFTVHGDKSELKYGAELFSFATDFTFPNPLGFTFSQTENTSELAAFVKYRKTFNRLVIEPSARIHNYSAFGETTFEPRFAAKLNATDKFRFKFSGGLYSQNLISTVSEKDIVNLFVGYLSGPEQRLKDLNTGSEISTRLQKAVHVVGGFEIDLGKKTELNVEAYTKMYSHLIDINRTKLKATDPNYIPETGNARGIDFSLKRDANRLNIWATYSLSFVERTTGTETYYTNFDRRHNMNLVATYYPDRKKKIELSARWNYGSGFPFTLTQGFFSQFPFKDGISTDVLTGQPNLGIIYASKRNGGRLPSYHRLDMSAKRSFEFTKVLKLDIVAAVTNTYNRENIFYFDRVNYKRVNQLPILPSVAMTLHF